MRSTRFVFVLLIGVLALIAGPVQAQRPEIPSAVSFAGIPFNFTPPGARSLGMGAAFIGIADDATASEANPAGLTILTRPEASLHFRYTDYSIKFFNPLAGEILTFFGQGNGVGRFEDAFAIPSFASFVKPYRKVVVSVYYQQAADFKGNERFVATDDFFQDTYTVTQNLEFQLEHIGVSAAFKIADAVSVGVSVRSSRVSLKSRDEFRIDGWRDLPGEPNVTDNFGLRTTFSDHDNDLTYNIGVLINPNGRASLGLVYKKGGDYNLNGVSKSFDECEGVDCYDNPFFGPGQVDRTNPFTVPDVFGVGIALRPSDQLTVAVDANKITYSDLNGFDGQNDRIDDGMEYHFGFEYTFFPGGGETPMSFRAGMYTDPDHDGYRQLASDEVRFTVGAGIVAWKNFQLDVAYAWGDIISQGLVSMVYRF